MIDSFSKFRTTKDFLDDLTYSLNNNNLDIHEINRSKLIQELKQNPDNFPMICFEETEDSDITVEMGESKFLTDVCYKDGWYVICNQDNYVALINMIISDEIKIEVLEVSKEYRGSGFGRIIVDAIEDCAENNNIDRILLSPFDSNAINFWSHLGYKESIVKGVCYFLKELDYE